MSNQAVKTNVTIRNAYKNKPDEWKTIYNHHIDRAIDIYCNRDFNQCIEDLILPLEDEKTYDIPGKPYVLRNIQNTAYAGLYAYKMMSIGKDNVKDKLLIVRNNAMEKLPELESWVNEHGKGTTEGRDKDREIWKLKGQIELINNVLELEG